MRGALDFVKSKEWALFVTAITALLSQLPALAELLQGEIDAANGKWTPTGLLIIAAGWAIRSNVFQTSKVDRLRRAKAESDLKLLDASVKLAGRNDVRAAPDETEALERARQGFPVPGINAPGEQVAQPGELRQL